MTLSLSIICLVLLSCVIVYNYSLQLDGDLNQVLFEAASSESEESINTLRHAIAERGGDANARTNEGESVLHLACIRGDVEKVKLLLEYGADPNYRASKYAASLDMTPLTWYVQIPFTQCPYQSWTSFYLFSLVFTVVYSCMFARCAYGNHVLAVEELLTSTRINVNLVVGQEDGGHITALDIAFKIYDGKNRDLINILQKGGAKTFQELLIQHKAECNVPGMPSSYIHSNCLD